VNLASVSPLPPQRSGISDYSVQLLQHLRPHFERLIAVVDGFEPVLEPDAVDDIVDLSRLSAICRDTATVPLYHIGCNTGFHGRILSAARKAPGFVVLHDGNLLPMVHELTVGAGKPAGFLREAAYERGREGLSSGWRALWGGDPLGPAEFPMVGRVARSSLGVIVHSQYLANRVRHVAPGARVTVIPHLDLMDDDVEESPATNRSGSGLDPGSLVIGAVGAIAPVKQIDVLLGAFSRLRNDFPHATILCLGETVPAYRIQRLVRQHGLEGRIHITGHVPPASFARHLKAIDIGVNLRHPTWGESSGALTRLMSCGVPTIVSNAGAYAELPDEVVLKVPAGCDSVDAVERALRDLITRPALRSRIGQAARSHVKSKCDPRLVASRYAGFIKATVVQGARQRHAGMPTIREAP
jgi:glycosyltransferase involved in cell wall biosynthesis